MRDRVERFWAKRLRCSLPVNRVGRRSGPVLDGRYHHRSLRSPREVRRALAYVLLDARRHLAKIRGVSRSATVHLDGASSARWFDGWRPEAASRFQEASGAPEIARVRAPGCCAPAGVAMGS